MTDTLQITMTVTDAGRAAVTNAQNNGLSAEVTHIAIGSGSGTHSASDTALLNEIKKIPTGTGSNPSPDELYTEISDYSGDVYSMYEFAAVLGDGTLLAIYRQNTPIIETTAFVPLLLQISIPIKSFPPGSVVINGDTNFQTPLASETLAGMAEIATQDEADDGTDHKKIITPKTLKSRLASFVRNATETIKGFAEIATQGEVDAGTDDSKIVTAEKLWGLLTAKFARTDVRPTFYQGIQAIKTIKFGGGSTQFEGIRYDDTTDQPGTFHLVADGSHDETSEGNAFIKIGGFTLSSGSKVTSVSDSTNYDSSVVIASSKALKSTMDVAKREATESQKGQIEIANQSEANGSTDDIKALTPKKLYNRTASESRRGVAEVATQAETNAGTDHTRIVTPKTLKSWSETELQLRIPGELGFFTTETPPPGFFALDGSTIPNGKNDFPALASSGSEFITISGNDIILKDAADFIRGQGSSSRGVGDYQADELKSHSHSTPANITTVHGPGWYAKGSYGTYSTSTYSTGGSETRPKSLTALICIYHGVI